ncbi:AMP-binding protein [Actinomadura sp. DC4]|uniref:AMP-binding protein n=1 Tax=Actinomadura sp. DC4 TaxID=3055069 RepID=UPI0025AF3539|nr:AMP-binding protein [Actinomadura sp. DC4]MDN3357403.1 AMP-binding protein [Actinomadura sp. DC4]
MPGPSPDANLAEVLSQWTRAFGWSDRVAFLCGDDVYTHGEVHRGAARMASLLVSYGIGPGDRVILALPGSIEFVWAFLATVRIGAVAVLADPDTDPETETAKLVVSGRLPHALTPAELIAAMPAAGTADPYPVRPDTPAYGRYATTFAHGEPEEDYLAMEPFGLRENDVLFSVPKTEDPLGLRNTIFLPLFSGASAVLDSGQRSVPVVAERVRRHRASVLLSSSAFFSRVAMEGPQTTFEPLRIAVSYGATPPPSRVEQWLGCPVVTP